MQPSFCSRHPTLLPPIPLRFFSNAPRLFHFSRWLRSNISLHSPAVDQGFLQGRKREKKKFQAQLPKRSGERSESTSKEVKSGEEGKRKSRFEGGCGGVGLGGSKTRSTAGLKATPPTSTTTTQTDLQSQLLNNAAFFSPCHSFILSPTIDVLIRNSPHPTAAVTSPPPLSSFPLHPPRHFLQHKRASESPRFQRRENKKKTDGRREGGKGGGWWWWWGVGRENQRRTDANNRRGVGRRSLSTVAAPV